MKARGEERNMRIRSVLVAVVGGLTLSACSTVSMKGRPEAARAPRSELEEVSRLERVASSAADPCERARARICLALRRLEGAPATESAVQESLREFYEARALCPQGPVSAFADRAIGRAYFQTGNYSLARRYLKRGIADTEGEERQLVAAMLVVSCRNSGDLDAAIAYRRSELSGPLSPAAEEILYAENTRALRSASGPDAQGPESTAERVPLWPAKPSSPERPQGIPEAKQLYVLGRATWGANPTRANVDRMQAIRRITVHHTAGPCFWDDSPAGAAREIKNIQSYHQNSRGWADIGYHFLIDRAGNIWQGRHLRYQGAHTSGTLNEGNIGIALLGNFSKQKPTRAQLESLSALLAKLCEVYNLSARDIYTHGELARFANRSTSCPGPYLANVVEAIRRNLERRLVAYRPAKDGRGNSP